MKCNHCSTIDDSLVKTLISVQAAQVKASPISLHWARKIWWLAPKTRSKRRGRTGRGTTREGENRKQNRNITKEKKRRNRGREESESRKGPLVNTLASSLPLLPSHSKPLAGPMGMKELLISPCYDKFNPNAGFRSHNPLSQQKMKTDNWVLENVN